MDLTPSEREAVAEQYHHEFCVLCMYQYRRSISDMSILTRARARLSELVQEHGMEEFRMIAKEWEAPILEYLP